mmetsp:Transcript_46347/g.112854  ORF Transcript_46347/g.112854 Transcript_46347/m.112854 type:complete len:159 (+) Transcript_46347:75-551(+)|eukprot:CAMPEP_0206241102 /NCGR_PEP_ID=MMETSP0047_2-20121206/16315_1 /ASSEMBLY_ACC=CAM_ASM_000192 /TAXON_ID=195065 /ORGANISM="Chroomonas mesostigmatica_cf, Strain CCMP1168" /LENGTH=158 /DNA_ID=CAMNT_0053665973 /DNA_START=26 /DNA_END=502 /DNA_ORIENTATION=+
MKQAPLLVMGAVWSACVVGLLLFASDGPSAGRVELENNWRTNNDAVPCAEDPKCGYGNVNLDPAAYDDESPLAIINMKYDDVKANPFPGPRNYGPDSPYIWLSDEAADGIPAAKVYPDYPEPKATSDRNPQMAILRMLPTRTELVRRPLRPVRFIEVE